MNPRVDRIEVQQVLYVEDEPVHGLLMRAAFAQRPHLQLLVASDGAQATALAADLEPSLLLFDEHLPDCLGSELQPLLRLRFGWGQVPAIVVTSDDALDLARTGFVERWTKPIDPRHVLRRLDHWLPPEGELPPGWQPMSCLQVPPRHARRR